MCMKGLPSCNVTDEEREENMARIRLKTNIWQKNHVLIVAKEWEDDRS